MTFEKRLAIAEQVKVGDVILKINGDGTVAVWHGKKRLCRRLMRHW